MATSALQRHQALLVLLAAAVVSLPAGALVAGSGESVPLALMALVGLSWVVVLVGLPVRTLFLGWLFMAPIFQVGAEANAALDAGVWAIYTVPAVIFLVMTLARLGSAVVRPLDFFPAAYLVVVLASYMLTSADFQSRPAGALRGIFLTVGVGIVVYYFLTLGPGSSISSETIVGVFLWTAVVQGMLALVELATKWTVWGYAGWQDLGQEEYGRVVGTLVNPAVLGAYLGAAIVTAVAILTYRGPIALRRPALVVLLVGVPGILATLTRAPILATLAACVVILILGRARYVAAAVLVAAAIAVVALLPSIRASEVYQKRVSERTNIQVRATIQEWSIALWKQEPLLGHGFGSFDRVKAAARFSAEGLSTKFVAYYTSHNTYLTMLVEQGLVGVLLFAVPFGVICYRAFPLARAPSSSQWLATACLASLLVVGFTGSTIDMRFFSMGLALPWFFLALLRRSTDDAASGATPA